MGTADLVPGISGGTVAFILGFYQKLIHSLKLINDSLLEFSFEKMAQNKEVKQAASFLGFLLLGILTAVFSFASILKFLLETPLYYTFLYSLFLGFIFASIYCCLNKVRNWSFKKASILCSGLFLALIFLHLPNEPSQPASYRVKVKQAFNGATNYDAAGQDLTSLSKEHLYILIEKQIVEPQERVFDHKGEEVGSAEELARAPSSQRAWIFLSGALAICALLLPGISGSHILILMGVYSLVIESLVSLSYSLKEMKIPFEALEVLILLGLGILFGIACFSRFLNWLMEKHEETALLTLSGFMIGGMEAVWPYRSFTYQVVPEKIEQGIKAIPGGLLLPSIASWSFLISLLILCFGFFLIFWINRRCCIKSPQSPLSQ